MKNNKKLFSVLIIFLCISMLSISVGFSAMSTTLSIDGYAYFTPVDMIRVVSFEKDEFNGATEISSNYKIDEVNPMVTIDSIDGYAIYNVKITNLGEVDKVLSNIEKTIYSNNNISYEFIGFGINDLIEAKETKEFKIKFSLVAGASLNDNRLNAKFKFIFDDYVDIPVIHNYDYYAANCTFNGKSSVSGTCNNGDNTAYINTGIRPFSSENYTKNFIMEFTLSELDDSRLVNGKQDTFMSALYEANDKAVGRYPGILFRVEDRMLNIHVSNGHQSSDYAIDKKFSKAQILGKKIKILRYNDGESIKLYYSLDNDGPYLLMDITDLSNTFDTPLTFGANLDITETIPDRYSYGTLENISFEYVDDNTIKREFNKSIEEKNIVFDLKGPCTFNGKSSNIVGCPDYSDTNYINTGIYLFNNDNYTKDFDIRFTLSNYDPNNQEESQVTIMNAFKERTGKGYGILLRRANNQLSMIIRDGNGLEKSYTFKVNEVNTFRIVRKGNDVCYSVNNSNLKYVMSYANFAEPFNVPLTFGSSIDRDGNPWRYIKGELSDMHVEVGKINEEIICN